MFHRSYSTSGLTDYLWKRVIIYSITIEGEFHVSCGLEECALLFDGWELVFLFTFRLWFFQDHLPLFQETVVGVCRLLDWILPTCTCTRFERKGESCREQVQQRDHMLNPHHNHCRRGRRRRHAVERRKDVARSTFVEGLVFASSLNQKTTPSMALK
jgi:hypothetical protein